MLTAFGKMVFLLLMVVTMFGCREYNLYRYEPVTIDVLDGRLVISVEGVYGQNYVNGGKESADFGYPYSLQFMFAMPYEHDLAGLKVVEIKLVGGESGRKISLPDIESNNVKDPRRRTNPDADARTIIASMGGLTADEFSYEDYVLSATVIVVDKSGRERAQEVSVSLRTNFTKERRSDWFDKFMSV